MKWMTWFKIGLGILAIFVLYRTYVYIQFIGIGFILGMICTIMGRNYFNKIKDKFFKWRK